MVQLSTFISTPTKQVLAGLNTGGGRRCSVQRGTSLFDHTHIASGDLNYQAGSDGPLSVVQLWPISYQNCQIFLNVTFFFFFANLLGLGLTRILLPPFMLYL